MLSLAAWAAFQFSWHSFRCARDDKSPSLLIKSVLTEYRMVQSVPLPYLHIVLILYLTFFCLCFSYSAQKWSSVIRTKICYCLFTQGPNLGRMGRLDLSLLSTVEGCAEVKNVNRWTPDPRTASKLCKRLAIMKSGVVSVWSSQFLSQCGSFMSLFTFFDSQTFLWKTSIMETFYHNGLRWRWANLCPIKHVTFCG